MPRDELFNHRRIGWRPIWLSGILALARSAAWASFQNTVESIKAEAMGGAFVAMADDPTAVFRNPAGLNQLQHLEASLMYGRLLTGVEGLPNLSQGYTALGLPITKQFAMGAGATMFNASGLLSEYQWTGGASFLLISRVALGASVSYLYHSYDIASDPAYANSEVFANGHSKGALGVNVGVLGFVSPRFQIGLAGNNLNSPDVGLRDKDPVPRRLSMGVMYRAKWANLQLEMEQRDDRLGTGTSQQNLVKAGIEIPIKAVSVRAGKNNNALTAGFGLTLGAFGLDYAFSLFNKVEVSNYGNQMLAIRYQIGGGGRSGANKNSGTEGRWNFKDEPNGDNLHMLWLR